MTATVQDRGLLILPTSTGQVVEVESDINTSRLLEGLEFLFQDGSMRFGLERAALVDETLRINMIDEAHSKQLLLTIFITVIPMNYTHEYVVFYFIT